MFIHFIITYRCNMGKVCDWTIKRQRAIPKMNIHLHKLQQIIYNKAMTIHDIKESFSNSYDETCMKNTSFSLAIACQMNYICMQDSIEVSSIRK